MRAVAVTAAAAAAIVFVLVYFSTPPTLRELVSYPFQSSNFCVKVDAFPPTRPHERN